jgi:AsmA family protein
MTLKRLFVAIAVALAIPIVLLAVAIAVVQSESAERWIEARVAQRIEREVNLEGIEIELGWPPTIHLQRLRIANPAWATTPALIDAEKLSARVEVLPLLRGRIAVPFLRAERATAGLERDGERATWRFGDAGSKPSPLALARIQVANGSVVYRDASERIALDIAMQGSAGVGGDLALVASGRFRGEPVKANARIPSLDPSPTVPIRLNGNASIGGTQITADGTLAQSLETLDLALTLAGKSMKDLRNLFGTNLPDTPPYRITGRLRRNAGEWVFEPFDGTVGDSDMHGSATYRAGGARRSLQANLTSKLLDFDDLGPVVGAPPKTGAGETSSREQQRKAAAAQAKMRVLPADRFPTEQWGEMDADVRLSAKRVLRPQQVPIDSLQTRIVMEDRRLTLAPLSFGVAGGRVSGPVVLNAREKPLAGNVDLEIQGLQLGRLFPALNSEQQSIGTLYGRAKLSARGDSIGALLGASDGQIAFAVDGGSVSLLLVELLGLDVAESLQLLGTRNRQVRLRCAVGDLKVEKGVATPTTLVIDTTDTVVRVVGTIDFQREALDLVFHPEPKDPSIFALRSPIHLQGPFKDPKVRPEAGPIVARVAAAAALAALNPVLALIPFIETGPGEDSDCGRLIAQARAKGAAKKTP